MSISLADHEERIAKLEKLLTDAYIEIHVLRVAQGVAGDRSKAFYQALESRYSALRKRD